MPDLPYVKSLLPENVGTGIIHLGLGAFHRAHQAVYTEDSMVNSGGDWGIESVSMRNNHLSDVLSSQSNRFTLVELAPDGPSLREISSIRKSWSLPDEADAIADRIADPSIHIITITVTEKGYCANPGAEKLDRQNSGIIHDLVHPDQPKTLMGILALGLEKRMSQGGTGLSILSCDNLPENGKLLRVLLIEFVALQNKNLSRWIDTHCTFPCTMVDRITPATSEKTLQLTERALSFRDEAAVETEPFSQWVIEDDFTGPRPDWEAAGVLIVDDVVLYELMKLRMLNGAHSLIAYLGIVENLRAVRDVMSNPLYRKLVHQHMMMASKSLKPIPGFSFETYAENLIERFSNLSIEHLCSQIAMDGSQKLPQRILAPMQELINSGHDVSTCSLSIALWIRHIELSLEGSSQFQLNDPLAEQLQAAVSEARGDTEQVVRKIAGILQPGKKYAQWSKDASHLLQSICDIGVSDAITELVR